MIYKGYRIEPNENRNPKYPNCDFVFHNLNDCDEPMGTGESVEDCKRKIDELCQLL